MADHHAPAVADNDYVEHEKTYALFTNYLVKWGTIATIIIVLFIGAMTSLIPWALMLFVSALLLGIGTKM